MQFFLTLLKQRLMSKDQPKLLIELRTGEKLVVQGPADVVTWVDKERIKWEKLQKSGVIPDFRDRLSRALEQIRSETNQWQNVLQQDPTKGTERAGRVSQLISEFFSPTKLLTSSSPEGIFVLSMEEKFGIHAASAAYTYLTGSRMNFEGAPDSSIFTGIINAFLFKNDIKWSGQAYQTSLNQLKSDYQSNLIEQKDKLDVLEERNAALNDQYASILAKKTTDLESLLEQQSAEFKRMASEHVANLKAIEETYDAKLSLQKPVRYWKLKRMIHQKSARTFLWWSVAVGVVSTCGLSFLAYATLGGLKENEAPQHWQLGVLIVAVFFAIWAIRLIVRMLLSHLHLATDGIRHL